MVKQLLLCDCARSQSVDADAIGRAGGLPCSRVHSALCTSELQVAAEAMAGGEIVIACGQEVARFEELAQEIDAPVPGFVDIRDRAGWSEEGADAGPKQAALVAEAQLPDPAMRALDVTSEGMCLIVGSSAVALPAAVQLCELLSVTVLLTDDDEPPLDRRFDVIRGRLARVEGALGGFRLRIDALQQVDPAGRGFFDFTPPRDGGETQCDILMDLTGGTPFVTAPGKREGYLRADPGDQRAVVAAAFAASQLVGTFEKPLYVRLSEPLCAHSRAEQVGCTRCLDICPTGAISPAGEHVAIDPMICAGCGSCSALCPSGAITYDAPPVSHLFRRMETMMQAFTKAGGQAPRLLVHDMNHGAEMISLSARFDRGLPAATIPFALDTIAGFGHAEMLGALALGFSRVEVLLSPTTEREALDREARLAAAIASPGRIAIIDDVADPERLTDALLAEAPAPVAEPVLPMGSRRQVTRLAARALHEDAGSAAPLALPEGAPYGAVLVDTDACTLCLSCVSLCPSGALMDNEDKPQLLFQEDACLQCGLCANICPEDAIALRPQLDLSDAALSQKVLNEEEPAECVECGAAFGVKSTIERISAQLAGKHPMFASGPQARMIRMCDDCRVNAQYHMQNNPFAAAERPRTRTTDDYYSERKDH
ncbi:4Fe-4S binding protein [Profundibacterium mesophilum]|uniref:Formylmethanofuran dehydrogenase subunit F n=1 Tax=Profundibacterium mesophilum KAUST100406-0324 TaxID=1037889 RepID=A0A921NSA9_9RHOB|nr:4Fe-4S binding protein [Profundibacterium mesophilum]KAF0676952.1 formylmethanofuran dehydrogenase subunit F [Profundibacterium mesophilum KAUST100406-0324]